MEKRQVPQVLQVVLRADVIITDIFCKTFDAILPPQKFESVYAGLEWSCHGIPWIAGWLAFIWLAWEPSLFEMQVNFLLGLVMDLVAVCIVKALTRRRRPPSNRPAMFGTIGPDKFSFPSGHVSRSFFIANFFLQLYSLNLVFIYLLWIWASTFAISRVLMRRHHVLDVVGGLVLGFTETWMLKQIWLSSSTCNWFIMWLSDDKLDGGEYHV